MPTKTKTKTDHTPVPWHLKKPSPVTPVWPVGVYGAARANGAEYAALGTFSEQVNAEFIVRAVNMHAKLQLALEGLVYVVGHNSCTDGKTPNGFAVALDQGREVLKELGVRE